MIDSLRADYGNTNAAVLRHWKTEILAMAEAEPSTPAEPQHFALPDGVADLFARLERIGEREIANKVRELGLMLGTERTMRAAWEKRAYQAEAEPSAPAELPKDYEALYYELIYEVATKHPSGESRHETAKRYIRERETPSGMQAQQATTRQEPPSGGQHHPACDPGWGPRNYRCHPECQTGKV
jgi:hypothetical protein